MSVGCKYVKIIKENSNKPELVTRQLHKLRRIVGAYQLLNNQKSMAKYLHTIRIRSMLNQQPTSYRDDRHGSYYPFMIFSVSEKDTILMLEIDFLSEKIIFRLKDHQKKEYGFSQIQNILQGREHNLFIIEFNFGKNNCKTLETVYQGQRDLIVNILIYASQVFALTESPKYSFKKLDF